MIYYSPGGTLNHKIEFVRCNRYDAIRVTRYVPSFTRLRSRIEVKGVIQEQNSDRHDVRLAVGTYGGEPSGMSVRASSLRSLRKSLLQTLVRLLPRNRGRAVAVEVLLRNRVLQTQIMVVQDGLSIYPLASDCVRGNLVVFGQEAICFKRGSSMLPRSSFSK